MNTEVFIQKTSNLFVENRLLKFVIVVLAFAVSFNSFMVYRAVKYQRVVLIPPKMTGTVEFVQGKPTDKYLRDISRRIVTLATSYSPPTARAQFEELLSYFAPESYPEASRLWYSLASRVEESQVSSVYYLEKIKIGEDFIEIFGNLKQFAGNTPLDNTSKTYIIRYRLHDGRFYALSFKEKYAELSEAKGEGKE
ncbi:MAG: type IV conjugative transfer system protein TraE [Desulfocapsa sp.]|uniref:Type IV conjugative transfer system protein TraE n=1 Tax=Desulfotalea psychrophila TaxID=84980 RepID=A0ABS3AX78_9BACT|nr:type IV conjugative transfer system protein TraE [Desulfocapsa sp.]MBN4068492.1 type IV conjugative transfer system protein TraE [Desulfotalea psychrophila]